MSGVPYVFGNATTSIPLSQLDVNFATNATLGNASVGLGNTTTTVGNLTLTNTTITTGNVTTDLTVHGLTVGLGGGSQFNSTAVGANALNASNSGQCSAFGYNALTANTTGRNVGIGTYALTTNTTGTFNNAFGDSSLYSNTTGNYNTAVGYQAGYNISTGQYNVCLGSSAGYNGNGYSITTGSRNICIGYGANLGGSGADVNEIVITTRGDTSNGKGSSTGYIDANGGSMYSGTNLAVWQTSSDQRLKKNIVTNTDGLNKISQLTVRNFEYRLPEEVDPSLKSTDAINITGVQLGFIAQELQAVLPDCVTTESTGVLSVNIDNVIYHMINAIKDLNTLVTAQATEIAALKAKVGA